MKEVSEKPSEILVQVNNLSVEIDTGEKRVFAVNEVSFEIFKGEFLALVGESGCGKTLTALSIIGLAREIPGSKVSGRILFRSGNSNARVKSGNPIKERCAENANQSGINKTNTLVDVVTAPFRTLQKIRGKEIAVIFQDPISSLNPVFTIGEQIVEPLMLHVGLTRQSARREAIALLRKVGIDDPEHRFSQYPHQLSGGMRQRVMIAMALSTSPSLIIADEPTTALDVTVQAQILHLLSSLQREFNTAVLLITHNLGIVAGTASRVLVMYAGKIVEATTTKSFFKSPHHPYSLALLRSLPRADRKSELVSIPGQPPDGTEKIRYCPFAPRCERAKDICRESMPEPELVGDSLTACFFPY